MKKQHYMKEWERYKLEGYLEAGRPVSWIAAQLGFCRQTIYNEIKRGRYECVKERGGYYYDEIHYSADKAQQIHRYNQTAKGRPLKIGNDLAYANYLENKMLGRQPSGKIDRRKRYSPGAALAQARKANYKTTVCVTTLYSYIKKGVFLHIRQKDLWYGGRKKNQDYEPVQRIAHPKLPSIEARPQHINERAEPGHWEGDLVVSCAKSKSACLTLTERKSREELIIKLPNRKASTIRAAIDQLEKSIPDFRERFKSITFDNGPEFLEYEKLRQSIGGGTRFDIYYCHSYAAWEKGTNENHNRMIRRWYPKGTDFTKVPGKEITELQHWMNHYPRRSLGWKSPIEAGVSVTRSANPSLAAHDGKSC